MPATPLTPNDRSPESIIIAEAQTLREENKDLKRRLEAAEAIIHGYSQHETEGFDTSKFFDNETSEDANFARRGKDIDQRQLCFGDLEDDVVNCAANSAVLEESRGENTAEAPALSQVDTCATNSGVLEESSGENADATEAKKGDESKSAALTFFAQNQCDSQRKILEWTNPWGDHSELIVDDFVRLLDGRWLSDRLINWHVVYLYEAAHKRGIHVETTYFASKLLSECSSTGNLFCVTISLTSYLQSGTIKEDSWLHISKYAKGNVKCFRRVIYPVVYACHFSAVVLDIAGHRRPRVLFIDPLQIYDSKVRSSFVQWFNYQNIGDFSTCNIHGGIQGDNATECGVFLLQNLDILLEEDEFFSIQQWATQSETRTVETCRSARKKCKQAPTSNNFNY